MMQVFDFAVLSSMFLLSVGLILSKCYSENWLQWFGLAGISVYAAVQIDDALAGAIGTEARLLDFGIALYLAGTAIKVYKYRHQSVAQE